jgi:hypothetical protein
MVDDRYYVSWSPEAKSAVRELAKRAMELGLLDNLKRTLQELHERLEREPLEVGELYRMRGPVVDHAATHNLVSVNFAVDTQRRVVAVRRCQAASGRGL